MTKRDPDFSAIWLTLMLIALVLFFSGLIAYTLVHTLGG